MTKGRGVLSGTPGRVTNADRRLADSSARSAAFRDPVESRAESRERFQPSAARGDLAQGAGGEEQSSQVAQANPIAPADPLALFGEIGDEFGLVLVARLPDQILGTGPNVGQYLFEDVEEFRRVRVHVTRIA